MNIKEISIFLTLWAVSLILVIVAVFLYAQAYMFIFEKKNYEYGTWIWTPITQMTPEMMASQIGKVAENNFNAIYITTDEYLEMANLPESERERKISEYYLKIDNFISLAKEKGISVDAEAGWSDWAEPENAYKAQEIMNFVDHYNGSHEHKFRAVQFDVEPYLLPTYEDNKEEILTKFVIFVEGVSSKSRELKLPVTFVIPHFYDSGQGWTPKINFNGKSDYAFNHMISILGPLKNSKIIIMAYRNFAEGENGSLEISAKEIEDAEKTDVEIIIAQETGDTDPALVTFYGYTRADLFSQLKILAERFKNNKSFGGFAIHYLDVFLDLP